MTAIGPEVKLDSIFLAMSSWRSETKLEPVSTQPSWELGTGNGSEGQWTCSKTGNQMPRIVVQCLIPALGRLRQEDHNFKTSMYYIARKTPSETLS